MSYKTYNLILRIDNDREPLLEELTKALKYCHIQEFFTPFNGIVCQINDNLKKIPFENFNDINIKSEDDVIYWVEEQLKDYCLALSKGHPQKKIAFITVDCFGGQCTSNGFIIQNGDLIYKNETHPSAHVEILKKIDPTYSTWHFYPFTRDFYSRKAGVIGGIIGDITDMSLPAIWMTFNIKFGNKQAYTINVSKNELVVEKNNFFEFYFMVINEQWIKILGRIYNDSEENLLEMENAIKENFNGFRYTIQFDLFENGYQKKLSSISEEISVKLANKSYRENAFNERPFVYPNSPSEVITKKKEKVDQDDDQEDPPLQGNIFKRIFMALFGS